MNAKGCIRVGHLKIVDHLILGITAGRLEKKEIELPHFRLETVAMNTWGQVTDALLDGSIDGAFLLAPAAMELFGAGLDLKLLMLTHRSGSIIVKSKVSTIQTLSDFNGKVLLIPHILSIHHMLMHRLMMSVGLSLGKGDDADVTVQVMPPFMMPEAMKYDQEGEIGGYIVSEPFGTQAVEMGFAREFCLTQKLWPNHPCCGFVLRDAFIQDHPETVQAMVTEFFESAGMIETGQEEELVNSAQQFFDQEPDCVRRIVTRSGQSFAPAHLLPEASELDIIQDYLVGTMAVMSRRIQVDDFIESRFARRAAGT